MESSATDMGRESAVDLFDSTPYVQDFIRMCAEGAVLGWHEANGGNASYRLTEAEAAAVEAYLTEAGGAPSEWEQLPVQVPALANAMFLVSATGSFMGKLAEAPAERLGIVQLDDAGESFRTLLGFSGGARPTSEFAGHLLIHEARSATDSTSHVLYHAHPDAIIALSKLVELTSRTVTRTLWKATTECILVVPEGVGVVPCLVPGSLDLARASAEQMRAYRAVVWAQHGLLCAGSTFDDAFGRMQSLAKAANIHLLARMAAGGNDGFRNAITDADLRAISEALCLDANEAFLGAEGE